MGAGICSIVVDWRRKESGVPLVLVLARQHRFQRGKDAPMGQDTPDVLRLPGCGDVLTEILRDGAKRLLGQAVEAEVEACGEDDATVLLVDVEG